MDCMGGIYRGKESDSSGFMDLQENSRSDIVNGCCWWMFAVEETMGLNQRKG